MTVTTMKREGGAVTDRYECEANAMGSSTLRNKFTQAGLTFATPRSDLTLYVRLLSHERVSIIRVGICTETSIRRWSG